MEELILDLIDYNVEDESTKMKKKELSPSMVIRRATQQFRNTWKNVVSKKWVVISHIFPMT